MTLEIPSSEIALTVEDSMLFPDLSLETADTLTSVALPGWSLPLTRLLADD